MSAVVFDDIEMISSADKTKEIVALLISEKQPIAVDCEGRLGVGGKLALLQVGTHDGKAYLFDSLKSPIVMKELKSILECEDVVKVFHACKADSGVLHDQFNITLNSVFDTQIADGLLIREKSQSLQVPCRSLNAVLEDYGGPVNPVKSDIREKFKDPHFWWRRPLTEDMMRYAAADVIGLVPTVYESLRKELESKNLLEECVELSKENVIHDINREDVQCRQRERLRQTEESVLESLKHASDVANREFTNRETAVILKQFPSQLELNANLEVVFSRIYLQQCDEIKKKLDNRRSLEEKDLLTMKNFLEKKPLSFKDEAVTSKALRLVNRIDRMIRNIYRK